MKQLVLIVLFILSGLLAIAQDVELENKGAFEFSYANDVTGMTDQYYTNGVGFSLTLPAFSFSPFKPFWLRHSNYSHAYHTVNFQYDVFTPDLSAELYTDRPFEKAAPSIRNGAMRINANAALNMASVQDQLSWFQSEGLVKASITTDTRVDGSYVEMMS